MRQNTPTKKASKKVTPTTTETAPPKRLVIPVSFPSKHKGLFIDVMKMATDTTIESATLGRLGFKLIVKLHKEGKLNISELLKD